MIPFLPLRRAGALCLVGLVGAAGHVAAQAGTWRCSPTAKLAAWADGSTIPLSPDRGVRLPYGRDLTLLVATDTAVKDVAVRYQLSGARDGPRAGMVAAGPDDQRTCWAAALPRLHVNESGVFGALVFRPATFREGRSVTRFAADLLSAFAASPQRLSPAEFATVVHRSALAVVQASFQDDPGVLRVRTSAGGLGQRLDSAVAGAATANLRYVNVFNTIRQQAGNLERALEGLLASPAAQQPRAPACVAATDLSTLQRAASALHNAGDSTLARRLVDRDLPWPDCTVNLVSEVSVTGAGITAEAAGERAADRADALEAARALVSAEEVQAIALLAGQVLAMSELTAQVETINVPLGADLLERYTQLDVVSAYLPRYGMMQTFATATLYLDAQGADFAAKVRPEGDLAGRDRWGVILGYPVGSPVVQPDTAFSPEILVGVMWRANGVISLAGGKVIGRLSAGPRVYPWFVSINLDLSNLGPFQQLFARPDP